MCSFEIKHFTHVLDIEISKTLGIILLGAHPSSMDYYSRVLLDLLSSSWCDVKDDVSTKVASLLSLYVNAESFSKHSSDPVLSFPTDGKNSGPVMRGLITHF